ncbi:MAG: hypothetical protein K2F65_07455, partial [Eubacterium sp.]|nr:hypothetical protein [Eubacterium sp.]
YVSSEPRQKYEGKIAIDEDGNPVVDNEGNPVYELDASGKVVPELKDGEIQYIFEEDGKTPVYWKDEDDNIIFDNVDVTIEADDLDKLTTFITGIDINHKSYRLDILGADLDLANLAYCMINAMALLKPSTQSADIATLAEGDADADTDADLEKAASVKRRSDAFVDIYRALRRVINANDKDFITPLVQDVLPDATYNAVEEYVDNVLHPTTYNDDNILVTLIRVADELGEDFAFDVDEDAYGTYDEDTGNWTVSTNPKTWYNLLRITPEKVNEGEFTDATTATEVDRALETLWGTVNNVIMKLVFKDNDKINNLQDFAVENFMNDALLSTLAKAVFSLADNETVSRAFNILQVTMNKEYIVDTLDYYGYKELSTAVKNFNGKLSEIPWFTTAKDDEGNDIQVPSKQFGEKWYIDDAEGFENIVFKAWVDSGNALDGYTLDVSYRFSRALMVVLAPFSKLIEVLTTENVVQFGDADANISIQGSYGYTSAIKPFLDALACDTV